MYEVGYPRKIEIEVDDGKFVHHLRDATGEDYIRHSAMTAKPGFWEDAKRVIEFFCMVYDTQIMGVEGYDDGRGHSLMSGQPGNWRDLIPIHHKVSVIEKGGDARHFKESSPFRMQNLQKEIERARLFQIAQERMLAEARLALMVERQLLAFARRPVALFESAALGGLSPINRHILLQMLRAARGKPAQERRKIARAIGWSLATLDSKIKRIKTLGPAGLNRKGRSDRGRPRRATPQWVDIATAAFLDQPRPTFRAAHAEVAKRCKLLGLKSPGYTWCRRWVIWRLREVIKSIRALKKGNR